MPSKSFVNFYAWAVRLFLFAIPFLSLYIARSMFFPYITGRNFFFRILVELALAFWAGLIVLDKTYRPQRTVIFWAIAAFLFIVGLADIFGINPYGSFFGSRCPG